MKTCLTGKTSLVFFSGCSEWILALIPVDYHISIDGGGSQHAGGGHICLNRNFYLAGPSYDHTNAILCKGLIRKICKGTVKDYN